MPVTKKCMKANMNGNTLYDSNYMTFRRKQMYGDTKILSDLQGS